MSEFTSAFPNSQKVFVEGPQGVFPLKPRKTLDGLALIPGKLEVDVLKLIVEADLAGPSLTLRTLEELHRRMPDTLLRLVMGADLVAELHKWHRFDAIEALAPPLVVGRAGHGAVDGVALPDVSSTEVRRRLRAGENVVALVPTRVRDYSRTSGLYARSPS